MSDLVDTANDNEDLIVGAAIANVRRKTVKKKAKNPKQLCLFCGQPTDSPDHWFCCPECGQDYEKYQAAKKRNGEI